MQYKIHTAPIIDVFDSRSACPLCTLQNDTRAKLIDQYLNEAVMIPEYRVEVNRYGFCQHCLDLLFAGTNKLGLALQLQTRVEALHDGLKAPKNPKEALREAARIGAESTSCTICAQVGRVMVRYAQTVAQMYLAEEGFVDKFGQIEGFCLAHYGLLLSEARLAGSATGRYLGHLVEVQRAFLNSAASKLRRFTDQFDYRSGGNPSPETIPEALRIFRR